MESLTVPSVSSSFRRQYENHIKESSTRAASAYNRDDCKKEEDK